MRAPSKRRLPKSCWFGHITVCLSTSPGTRVPRNSHANLTCLPGLAGRGSNLLQRPGWGCQC